MKRLDFVPGFATSQNPLNVLLPLSRARIPKSAHPQILLESLSEIHRRGAFWDSIQRTGGPGSQRLRRRPRPQARWSSIACGRPAAKIPCPAAKIPCPAAKILCPDSMNRCPAGQSANAAGTRIHRGGARRFEAGDTHDSMGGRAHSSRGSDRSSRVKGSLWRHNQLSTGGAG